MANQQIPVLERKVEVSSSSVPDFQSTFQGLAASQNSLSNIGAQVAQAASNRMAQEMGYEAGKKPTGNLTPSFTEFDKNFAETYHSQAYATLSVQGQKLLTSAQLELSKLNKLTPQAIEDSHVQLQKGLNNIAANAPDAVRVRLQSIFDSQLNNHTAQFTTKMYAQQKEDEKNQILSSINMHISDAYELGVAGNANASSEAVTNVSKMANTAVKNGYLTPLDATNFIKTARQAYLNGTANKEAETAIAQNKFTEFENQMIKVKPKGMTDEEHQSMIQAVYQHSQYLNNLKNQDDNYRAQQMLSAIATDVTQISPTALNNMISTLSPMKAEQVRFHYIQAMKAHKKDTQDEYNLMSEWTNPEAHANATPKAQNATFNKLVNYAVQQSNGQITRDQAEVQAAVTSPAPIPVFTNSLKFKLHSGNPAYIESAANQIEALYTLQAGHALQGLSDADKALYTKYNALKTATDPVTAAREATNIIDNQDPAIQKANQEKWSNHLNLLKAGSPYTSDIEIVMKKFDIKSDSFANPTHAQLYGTDILNKYQSNFILTGGDSESAQKLTKRYLDENYGHTRINGGSYYTEKPIEQTLGFKSYDCVPVIQEDIYKQISAKIAPFKESFFSDDKKKRTDTYWEMEPPSNETHGLFKKTYEPLKINRYIRDGKTIKKDTFNLFITGDKSNYIVSIASSAGMYSLYQYAPYLGVINYVPNQVAITKRYNEIHHLK